MNFFDAVLETQITNDTKNEKQVSKRVAAEAIKTQQSETYAVLRYQLDNILNVLARDGEIEFFEGHNASDPVIGYKGQCDCINWEDQQGNNFTIDTFPPQIISPVFDNREPTWLPGLVKLNSWQNLGDCDSDNSGFNGVFILGNDIKIGALNIKKPKSLYGPGILYACALGSSTPISFNESFSQSQPVSEIEKTPVLVGEFLLKALIAHKAVFTPVQAAAIIEVLTGTNPVQVTNPNKLSHPYNFAI